VTFPPFGVLDSFFTNLAASVVTPIRRKSFWSENALKDAPIRSEKCAVQFGSTPIPIIRKWHFQENLRDRSMQRRRGTIHLSKENLDENRNP
jgi:hypothetical protein